MTRPPARCRHPPSPSGCSCSGVVDAPAPERALHLDLGPGGVRLTPSYDDTAASAELGLPVDVAADGIDLDLLRRTFRGIRAGHW